MRVIPDYILPEYQQSVFDTVWNPGFPWNMVDSMSGVNQPPAVDTEVARMQFGFSHTPMLLTGETSEWFPSFSPLCSALPYWINEDIDVLRVRVGMTTISGSSGAGFPHIDLYEPHETLLYYVNPSDGDTLLYKERNPDYELTDPQSFHVEDRISPQQGTAVLFDGNQYHSSSVPEFHTRRITVNINFRRC